MGKRHSAERRIDLAPRNRLELVQQRKLHPIDIDMELAPEMSDKRQGVLIKTAAEETDPQPACLAKGGLPAVVQRGADDQRSGLYAEAKFLAEGRQLNAPARSDEELPPNLLLQRIYRFGDGGLGERQSLRRFSEMQVHGDRQEAVDLPQFHFDSRVHRLIR